MRISYKKYPIKRLLLVFLISNLFFIAGCSKDTDRLQLAMDSFQLEPGLRIELVASEPLVVDPIAFAFDKDRRMYVVEDHGYPDPAEGGAPTKLGQIVLLEDTNGDGRYDNRTEFASGFTYPNGIQPWDGGVFVTVAPDIFYLKDTDGDGVADIRKVVLTGFKDTRTSQIRMSSPTLGPDGWIYVAGGLNGGEVTSPEHPDRPVVSYTAGDGRFNPETFEFQVTGGNSQFGLTIDPYGRRFGCSNRHPIQHIVLEPWHLQRNPYLLFTQTLENVSKTEAEAVVFPISDATTSADYIPNLIGRSHKGTFTAASGLLVFNGNALTPAHKGNTFICESAQNLVQRQIVHPDGVSFRSELPYRGREFLASTDEWFRPVFLQLGPEGALYLADMHRKVIDHPSYVPEEARAGKDFESGKSDGRIYRIVREDFDNGAANPSRLGSSASIQQIVHALDSPEEWERNTAYRLLLERGDLASVPLLGNVAVGSSFPESRSRALWLLYSLDALEPGTVKEALSDSVQGVREQAVRLGGKLSKKHPELVHAVASAAEDMAMRVRFISALALGWLKGSEVVPALAKIAARDGADHWMRAAVLSGIGGRMPEFLAAFREQNADPAAFAAVMHDLGGLFGNGASVADARVLLHDVIISKDDYGWRISTALGLAEGISGRAEIKISKKGPLFALLGENASKAERKALDKFMSQVDARAGDENERIELRVLAADLLGHTDFDRTSEVLKSLLGAQNPPELQLKAVAALARQGDVRGAELLTDRETWSSYTPRVRSAVIAALVSKPAFIKELFTAIEEGVIAPSDIPPAHRQRLMEEENSNISARAEDLFAELEGEGRMQVYNDYRQILEGPAIAASGKAVFTNICSACHTYNGEGGNVGPDLTGVKNQPADALLLHILVPNYEVYPAYQAISVTTGDGNTISGRIIAETENGLTLRTAFGTDESILRKNITSLVNTGRSLMPDGLEQNMTKEELAQLIAYIKSGG